MKFLKFEELSPDQLNSFDRNKTLFFMTLSPLENHGKHLPLGMDIFEGGAISEGIAEKFSLNNPDWNIVFCPHVTMGTGLMPGMGSISFKQSTLYNFLVEYLSSLTKRGFKHIFVSGFHAGLRHLVSIDEAIHYVNKKYDARVISPFGHYFTNIIAKRRDMPGAEINKIFRSTPGDLHGGMFETSFLLHVRPDLVKNHKSMKDIDVSQKNIFKKAVALKDALQSGYFGYPALSEARIGKLILDDSVEMFYGALQKSITDDKFVYTIKSLPYSQIYMRTNFLKKALTVLTLIVGVIAYFKYKNPKSKLLKKINNNET